MVLGIIIAYLFHFSMCYMFVDLKDGLSFEAVLL